MAPAPNLRHQRISRNLEFLLHDFVTKNALGEILDAPCDVFLDEINVIQPDLFFVGNNRSHLLSERGVEGAPDLIVEILSPSTRNQDLGPKKKIYAASGVSEYWVVDPDNHQVLVFRFAVDALTPVETLNKTDVLTSDQFAGLEIDLTDVFES